jgi:hypothetical protein
MEPPRDREHPLHEHHLRVPDDHPQHNLNHPLRNKPRGVTHQCGVPECTKKANEKAPDGLDLNGSRLSKYYCSEHFSQAYSDADFGSDRDGVAKLRKYVKA